ncbi:MAG: hypothetical protein JZU47_07715 [Prolixibacteraceae bacterium]|nr:hypothetical protein [Prolixibacteraceae bacterium]
MNIDQFTFISYGAYVPLEITVDDLLEVMNDFATEKESYLLANMDEEPSPVYISQKNAMNILNVTNVRSMIELEVRKYLTQCTYRGGIFYLQDEVLLLKNFAELLNVKPLNMKIDYPEGHFEKFSNICAIKEY